MVYKNKLLNVFDLKFHKRNSGASDECNEYGPYVYRLFYYFKEKKNPSAEAVKLYENSINAGLSPAFFFENMCEKCMSNADTTDIEHALYFAEEGFKDKK